MNPALRRTAIVCIVLFAALFIQVNRVQFFEAYVQEDDSWCNIKSEDFDRMRGSILAGEEPIAVFEESENEAGSRYYRDYPQGEYFGNVTGYASISYGANHLECAASEYLDGSADLFLSDKILASLKGGEQTYGNVLTSIDPEAQRTAYDAIAEVADEGSAVAIEPSTGRILAQVSVPGWDPGLVSSLDTEAAGAEYDRLNGLESNPMLDHAINEFAPPGSTFKTVVAAAYIEKGLGDADSMVPAGNRYEPPGAGQPITNAADQCAESELPLKEAFARSCNTTFSQICNEELSPRDIADMAAELGFEEKFSTPISSLWASTTGGVEKLEDKGIRAQACIGQNTVSASTLQNAVIASTVANDGIRMDPRMLDTITNAENETIHRFDDEKAGRAFSSDTADELKKIMEEVVTGANGTGSNAYVDGFTTGGKTGTAEHTDKKGDPLPDHGWFIGWGGSDSDSPDVAVAVFLPEYGQGGSSNATAIAGKIMSQVLNNPSEA
ncbi:penicillin-binding transpeptidase domain-containing protein [Salininema proteolyticum]|uniref:Penicillin-binding transpeptidase domain-containing protein n=1 Tax=Salininema proteolyticum TaxID=1607685 RepID=A0ABV8TW58_9ACTN